MLPARAAGGYEIKDIHPAPRADHAIQPGHVLHQRIAVALRQAAGRDHHLVSPLDLNQLAQGRIPILPWPR